MEEFERLYEKHYRRQLDMHNLYGGEDGEEILLQGDNTPTSTTANFVVVCVIMLVAGMIIIASAVMIVMCCCQTRWTRKRSNSRDGQANSVPKITKPITPPFLCNYGGLPESGVACVFGPLEVAIQKKKPESFRRNSAQAAYRLWIQSKFEKEFGKLKTGQVVILEHQFLSEEEEENSSLNGEMVPGQIV
uniref:Uncharacterized protein n=1 Tax=Ditylenchus dipsaci TaxID=166011 RepID=A0A915E4W8_9BILA